MAVVVITLNVGTALLTASQPTQALSSSLLSLLHCRSMAALLTSDDSDI